jgi:integrase/recombinase XerC
LANSGAGITRENRGYAVRSTDVTRHPRNDQQPDMPHPNDQGQPARPVSAVLRPPPYLLREATPKRSVRYSNNALAALDDFYVWLGLGKANVGRDELPKTAPKAMDARAEIRWLRAVESWPHARDRALALLPFYAGLRIGDVVALDVEDVRLSARKGVLRVFGKGAKTREVPVHPALGALLQAWLGERAGWPGADGERALFLSRRGGRLTTRAASDVFTAITAHAGLEEATTAHVGRHAFLTRLIRGGEDLITVAELAGHARLET